MTQNNDKKTLTLKTGTLGIKLGEKLANPGAVKTASSSGAKGKVVVVTKQTRGAGPKPGASGQGAVSDHERDKRLQLIKQAEVERKQREEQQRIKLAQQQAAMEASSAATQELIEEQAPEVVQEAIIEEQPVMDSAVVETANKTELSKEAPKKISLDALLRKGKVKNLDEMYRPAKPKEELPLPVPPAQAAIEKKPAHAKTFPSSAVAPKKKESDDTDANAAHRKGADDKFSKKISLAQVMMMDGEEGAGAGGRRRSMASIRRAREKVKRKMMGEYKPTEKIIRDVLIPDVITVQELANRMAEKTADVIKTLMKLGMMVTVNQSIDADTAELVISEFGHNIKRVTEAEIEAALLNKIEDKEEDKKPRAPVVTIMGHVDHGKTSLLDALRNTDVAAGEAGGITQHIGAYQITLESGKLITFLDTPGHEAFTAMRMRGAQVTDIVVLVVAADDGIMQQTIEAISHAKAAKVPIIVAVNKIDKPDSNPERVKQELLMHNIVPESMGGDAIVVEVSAKQKINLDVLEEAILLQAEMLDLKANPDRLAEGAVVEAKMDKGRGPVATLLVQKGTLKVGDIVVAGTTWGRARALNNDKGKAVDISKPSSPVEIVGLESVPTAGDEFTVVPNEKTARDLVSFRVEQDKQRRRAASKPASLDTMFKRALDHGIKELPIIVKADVQGSVEAIVNSLQKLATEEISVKVIHNAVGGIMESDVTLATASQALIIGFNVRASPQARELARTHGIELKYYSIIYNLVDDIKAAMGGMLSPTIKENVIGYVDIREVFDLTKYGKVAGCYVTEGQIKRNANARIVRDNVVIYDGKLKALRRFKDDVKEVGSGFECGLSFENYEDLKPGDKIEVYEVTEHARTI